MLMAEPLPNGEFGILCPAYRVREVKMMLKKRLFSQGRCGCGRPFTSLLARNPAASCRGSTKEGTSGVLCWRCFKGESGMRTYGQTYDRPRDEQATFVPYGEYQQWLLNLRERQKRGECPYLKLGLDVVTAPIVLELSSTPKRGRGRPKKIQPAELLVASSAEPVRTSDNGNRGQAQSVVPAPVLTMPRMIEVNGHFDQRLLIPAIDLIVRERIIHGNPISDPDFTLAIELDLSPETVDSIIKHLERTGHLERVIPGRPYFNVHEHPEPQSRT